MYIALHFDPKYDLIKGNSIKILLLNIKSQNEEEESKNGEMRMEKKARVRCQRALCTSFKGLNFILRKLWKNVGGS